MVVQMGERQTEDLDVAGSSPAHGITLTIFTDFLYLLNIFLIIFGESYLFSFKDNFKDYDAITIKNELLAGLTTSLALMPECIAFAIVAHLSPLVGLYTAAIICVIASLLGGRPGLISGAAGSVAVVSVALVVNYGIEYLFLAVVLMGIIQIFVGVFKLAKFIRLVPQPVVYGFLNGLAIIIFIFKIREYLDFCKLGMNRKVGCTLVNCLYN